MPAVRVDDGGAKDIGQKELKSIDAFPPAVALHSHTRRHSTNCFVDDKTFAQSITSASAQFVEFIHHFIQYTSTQFSRWLVVLQDVLSKK
jgi:hypothetical protein